MSEIKKGYAGNQETVQEVQPFPVVESVTSVEQVKEKKPYILRNLCARDVFPMAKIIRKIGLTDIWKCFELKDVKAITESLSDENGERKSVDNIAETAGISIMLKITDVILENLSTVEQEIFDFLAGLAGITADDVASLPMDIFFGMLVDIFEKKEFVGFMKVVSRLLK